MFHGSKLSRERVCVEFAHHFPYRVANYYDFAAGNSHTFLMIKVLLLFFSCKTNRSINR